MPRKRQKTFSDPNFINMDMIPTADILGRRGSALEKLSIRFSRLPAKPRNTFLIATTSGIARGSRTVAAMFGFSPAGVQAEQFFFYPQTTKDMTMPTEGNIFYYGEIDGVHIVRIDSRTFKIVATSRD